MKAFGAVKYVYLLGIGGIGMSALARYFNSMGKKVAGYDRTPSALTKELETEGIDVHYDDDPALILPEVMQEAEHSLIIYTPAIPKDHREFNHLLSSGFGLYKRSQVLGMITEGSYTIAVAGTHGKTTTSTMVAHILQSAGLDMAAFLGGISANYSTNLLLGTSNKYVVVEADEFDRSFLTLHPDVAVITSADPDHLDIYGDREEVTKTYVEFTKRLKANGVLFINEKAGSVFDIDHLSYGFKEKSEYRAVELDAGKFSTSFTFLSGNERHQYELGIPGIHNVENAVAAIAAARVLDIPHEKIAGALRSFKGVKRRFEYHLKEPVVLIDDYAHHPEELNAFIGSVKKIFPGKKITGIFQPHLYSRTRDFADGFMKALSVLHEAILLDIYPARELPIPGVSSSMLLSGITAGEKKVLTREELLKYIGGNDFEVVLTMGAGDIELLVEPIKEILKDKK